jgi:Tol biopolymer transport system component/DNA-binding winged helix-turn-helix (wHTH) protein
MAETSRRLLRFGQFEFSPLELWLRRGGERTVLQPKVAHTLEILADRPGRLVTKEELFDLLWPHAIVNEEALTQLVRKLRKALGDDPHLPRFIETIPKRGYRFLPDVIAEPEPVAPQLEPRAEAATDDAAPTVAAIPAALPILAVPRLTARRWALLAAAIVVIGAAALTAARLWRPPRSEGIAIGHYSVRHLTFSSDWKKQDPCFSPDSRFVAYAANDPAEGQIDVFVCPIGGSAVVRLTHTAAEEFFPQYSPAGDLIAFTRAAPAGIRKDIWGVSPLGGDERLLVPDGAFGSWSPAGDEIAFVRVGSGGIGRLVRRTLASGAELTVCTAPATVSSLAWSPDGRTIAYADGRAMWAVGADGGIPARVGAQARNLRAIAWDPSSRSLLCDADWSGPSNIWRVAVADGTAEPVTSATGEVFSPAVSRDGRSLVYVQEFKRQQLFTAAADGAAPRPLPLKATLRCVDVDASGSLLAFTDDDPAVGPAASRVGLVPFGGQPMRYLAARQGSCPVFSPAGGALAFVDTEAGRDGLWTVNLDEVQPRRVLQAESGATLQRPAWSPAGTGLAVATLGGAGGSGLLRVDTAQGGAYRLASGEFGAAAWSPDGHRIAVCGVAAAGAGLYVMDAESGTHRLVSARRSYAAAPVWSADSTSILLLDHERTRPSLVSIDLDGRERAGGMVFERPSVPGFWGIFEFRPLPGGAGWIFVLERYEADLFLLEADEQRAAIVSRDGA